MFHSSHFGFSLPGQTQGTRYSCISITYQMINMKNAIYSSDLLVDCATVGCESDDSNMMTKYLLQMKKSDLVGSLKGTKVWQVLSKDLCHYTYMHQLENKPTCLKLWMKKKKQANKQINKSFPALDSHWRSTSQISSVSFLLEWAFVHMCGCVVVSVCVNVLHVFVSEFIWASILLWENFSQSCNYTVLTRSRWLRTDTFGGAPHDGGDQCKIYVVAAHIHKCKISPCLSIK